MYHDARTVSVAHNETIFEIRYNDALLTEYTLQPVEVVDVCIKLDPTGTPSAGSWSPHLIYVNSKVSAVVPDTGGSTVVIHSEEFLVFVLPEPIINDRQGQRYGTSEVHSCFARLAQRLLRVLHSFLQPSASP